MVKLALEKVFFYTCFPGFFVFFFCRKKENASTTLSTNPFPTPSPITQKKIDTIKPDSYFPAYPGSWWTYKNSNGTTETHTVATKYVKDIIKIYDMNTGSYITYEDTSYVPSYEGQLLWKNNWHYYITCGAIYIPQQVPLVLNIIDSVATGYTWSTDCIYLGDGAAEYRTKKILKKDTTIIINDVSYSPTIVVLETYSGGYPSGCSTCTYNCHIDRIYYTKNIGITKRETLTGSVNYQKRGGPNPILTYKNQDSVLSHSEIQNYHINN